MKYIFLFALLLALIGGFIVTTVLLLWQAGVYSTGVLVLVVLFGLVTLLISAIGYRLLIKEVSTREQAERKDRELLNNLATSETRYRNLNEASNDAIIIMDASGMIISWNKKAHAMFGYFQNEALGKPFELILPEGSETFDTKDIQRSITSEESGTGGSRIESQGRHKSGYVFPIEITFSHWVANGTRFSSGAIRNITEEKRIRDQLHFTLSELKRSNEELEQFAYIASHDLQEPLRKIRAFGDRLLSRVGEEDNPVKEYALRMADAAHRMQVMVQDLLSFSRVSRNLGGREAVDLNEVVAQAVENLQIAIREAGAELHISKLPLLPAANATQMLQLFQNLISNAVKFRNERTAPVVNIKCTEIHGQEIANAPSELDLQKAYFQVSVIDNGVGFEPKYLDKVFTIFQRLHGHGEYSGTGIGLAVCKRICENHGGLITAKTAPGKGAEFIIYLPKD